MRQAVVFWGCTIPVRLPFIEKATRTVIADLGWQAVEPPGLTCCPESQLVKTAHETAYYATAARNLSIAREYAAALITPCSGCYSTFRQTAFRLSSDRKLRNRIEELLARTGHAISEMPKIWHLAEWLCEEIGPDILKQRMVRPLSGMRLAVHYGCHLLRPTPAVSWDNPVEPYKLERLMQALGAVVVDYPSKMECCGSGLERAGGKGVSRSLLARKFDDLRQRQVDALVVACPACFLQFDLSQAAGSSATAQNTGVPVFYCAELVALALGHPPAELGLEMHRVPIANFLDKWTQKLEWRAQLASSFDLSGLETCVACRACDEDCPARSQEGFLPSQVLERLLAGELEKIIGGPEPWRCIECMTCFERCHSRLGMAWIFDRLKELARERGHLPAPLRAGYQSFLSTGVLGTPRTSTREKLGLPSLPSSGGPELREMLARIFTTTPGDDQAGKSCTAAVPVSFNEEVKR